MSARRVDIMESIMANPFHARAQRTSLTTAIATLMLGLAGADAHASGNGQAQLRAPHSAADTAARSANKCDGDGRQRKPAAQSRQATRANAQRYAATRNAGDGKTVWERLYSFAQRPKPEKQTKMREIAPHHVGRPLPWETRPPKRVAAANKRDIAPAVKGVAQYDPQQEAKRLELRNAQLLRPVLQSKHAVRDTPLSLHRAAERTNAHHRPAASLQRHDEKSELAQSKVMDDDIIHISITASELGLDAAYRLSAADAVALLLHVSGLQPSDSLTHDRAWRSLRTTTVADECRAQVENQTDDSTRKLFIPGETGLKCSELGNDPDVVALIARVKYGEGDEPAYAVLRRSAYRNGWEAVTLDQSPREINGKVVSELVFESIDDDEIVAVEAYVRDAKNRALLSLENGRADAIRIAAGVAGKKFTNQDPRPSPRELDEQAVKSRAKNPPGIVPYQKPAPQHQSARQIDSRTRATTIHASGKTRPNAVNQDLQAKLNQPIGEQTSSDAGHDYTPRHRVSELKNNASLYAIEENSDEDSLYSIDEYSGGNSIDAEHGTLSSTLQIAEWIAYLYNSNAPITAEPSNSLQEKHADSKLGAALIDYMNIGRLVIDPATSRNWHAQLTERLAQLSNDKNGQPAAIIAIFHEPVSWRELAVGQLITTAVGRDEQGCLTAASWLAPGKNEFGWFAARFKGNPQHFDHATVSKHHYWEPFDSIEQLKIEAAVFLLNPL
ncbi:hypothetical protein GALL_339060 [mine drainage metagenome]|uniref:Uncharacterized protein n=1 Tax=mine drainage metagenome TaxID=410659 RepID=A0A1J5R7Z8_9ZZZZ